MLSKVTRGLNLLTKNVSAPTAKSASYEKASTIKKQPVANMYV